MPEDEKCPTCEAYNHATSSNQLGFCCPMCHKPIVSRENIEGNDWVINALELEIMFDKIGIDNSENAYNSNAPILPYIECPHCKHELTLLPVPSLWNVNHDIRYFEPDYAILFLERILDNLKKSTLKGTMFHPAY
nr:MAG: hypothetical protein [Lokiarchaeota virus Ratatoskr Meg22_1012]